MSVNHNMIEHRIQKNLGKRKVFSPVPSPLTTKQWLQHQQQSTKYTNDGDTKKI